jgi:RNA polymerase sigma-70 factor (ECF subfamily)
MSEGAVRVEAHRLRRRFAGFLREEIAQTVSDPSEVENELRYLMTVLGG